ncbi:MAG: N-acetylmuramoyl-L-alanine amidase [Patescibacteria group bacterium]
MQKLLTFIGLLAILSGIAFFFLPSRKKEITAEKKSETAQNSGIPTEDSETQNQDNNTDNNADIEKNKPSVIDDSDKKTTTSEEKSNSSISQRLVSWGYSSASGRTIDTIIIHSSYDAIGEDKYDVPGLIKEYKSYRVAPHYLIDRKGNIYQLVKDKDIAYHAGESKVPDGRSGVNNFSIGIELMNSESDSFTSAQYSSLNNLLSILKNKYKIKYVLGHDQIAPGRKTDPWNFNWKKIN